jgi:hypothetical protein
MTTPKGKLIMSAATGTPSTPSTAPATAKPKFGDVVDGNVIWIGGPPNDKWSGTHATEMASPQCLRGLDPKTMVYMYKDRTVGNSIKFKKDDPEYSLLSFAADAMEHMVNHGMDTVFYMEPVKAGTPPGETDGALQLFDHHSRFTKGMVSKAIEDRLSNGTFDHWAKEALKDSAKWLKESLDLTMKVALRSSLAKATTGPDVWMLIVQETVSSSINRCEGLADDLKALKLINFPGENVEAYCAKADELLSQLETEGELPTNHLVTIVDALGECSVLEFKVEMINLRSEVVKFKRDSVGKDPSVVAAMPNRITWQSVLTDAKRHYKDLLKKWGPSKDLQANQAESALNKMECLAAEMNKKLKSFNPSGGGGNGSSNGGGNSKKTFPGKTCHGCGAKDMIKPRCPTCSNKGKGKSSKTTGTNGGGSSTKWAAPKDGEPHTKEIDGKKLMWCAKCRQGKGFWNDSHLTKDHVVGFKKSKGEASGNVHEFDLSKLQGSVTEAEMSKLREWLQL